MSKSKTSYSNLSKEEKHKILNQLYIIEQKSFADIALEYHTYPNKIRRDAKALGLPIRNKSEAQKNALNTGKHKHPTKGTIRSDTIKQKIGQSVMDSWTNLSPQELQQRKDKAKDNWDKLDEETKKSMHRAAMDAVRVASKQGSKLEKFLLSRLLADGYAVDFHKEQALVNTKLQIDLFIPSINTAIEVDGPSHFEPVWGDDSLKKNISYDQKKEGLITGRGWHLVRIQQQKDFSKSRAERLYSDLVEILNKCINLSSAHKFTIKD